MKVYLECMDNGFLLLETDFILNYIFPDLEYKLVGTSILKTGDFVSEDDLNDCVLVFTSNLHTYSEILQVVNKIKPKVILHLSDEHIYENKVEYTELGNYCDLYLRQYNHPTFKYTSNTLHIPLGFTNFGFEDTPKGLKNPNWESVHTGDKKPSLERKYTWSFVGTVKGDRFEMINTFSKFDGVSKYTQTVDEVIELYSESIFVPCGRGNSSLDCFRLYEASACGAIPIVVGSYQEYSNTFKYENSPPWIFADSWQEALKHVTYLLDNPDILQALQNRLTNWWKSRLEDITTKLNLI